MDESTTDLVRQLCTRAGMLMEDMSGRAILVGGMTAEDLVSVVGDLQRAANAILALARAADMLLR